MRTGSVFFTISKYYLNTMVMAPLCHVLTTPLQLQQPGGISKEFFKGLKQAPMTWQSPQGVWSARWGEGRMWHRRMWEFC